ncbi:hypothetical protein A5755_07125 [Mycolicibacterium fortuitum]|nr:hypothetical protein A5754_00665 [Mycolicibacterium fortuitum]OBB79702.1 hypothetical protein A5755_07125 [Mycolicibacterium fortuitum]OBF67553.1 hypothetical protein A5751_01810 [Mycolicibacterium fortuitum]OBG09207.1 hypothetical protein A5768_15745 [Mycolicibacterium fortuitum]OBK67205.1 hypothetical protein A5654_17165 [Mycolicibacterium fortuitum]
MAAMVDAAEQLSTILAEHGPLGEDEIKRRLRAGGVADPDAVVYDALHMLNSPAGQLTDDRWVWLPTLLGGRVFTHRLEAPEVAHDMLTVLPDLGALTDLFEHEPYHRFADGAPVTVLMVDYDDELLEGDELRVETNSENRMDSALSTLKRLDAGVEILDDTREPVGDVRDLSDRFPGDDTDALDPDDPEVAAALDEYVREYETHWLDQPIPALDGYTPRQAADDPTRRGDLIKLLDSFPAGVGARGAMDVDRLRAALGLM